MTMTDIICSNQFKRDAKKHFLEMTSFAWAEVIYCLVKGLPLPRKYADHALTGNLKDLRDCHIKPDLVLLYAKVDDTLNLLRLGSHSELGI